MHLKLLQLFTISVSGETNLAITQISFPFHKSTTTKASYLLGLAGWKEGETHTIWETISNQLKEISFLFFFFLAKTACDLW